MLASAVIAIGLMMVVGAIQPLVAFPDFMVLGFPQMSFLAVAVVLALLFPLAGVGPQAERGGT
jgi:hypothetical protein